jgi:hypothetical protein
MKRLDVLIIVLFTLTLLSVHFQHLISDPSGAILLFYKINVSKS